MDIVTVQLSDGNCLANQVRVACNFFDRLRGLLGTSQLSCSEGIILERCNSIHTIGMSMTIDVIFLDQEYSITRICHNVPPKRIRLGPPGTTRTLELAAGVAQRKNLTVNRKLVIQNL